VKTISKFREALGAELFCFSDARQLEKESPVVEGATAVKSVHFPVLRQLAYSEKTTGEVCSLLDFFNFRVIFVLCEERQLP
jgi:hypothetical protein